MNFQECHLLGGKAQPAVFLTDDAIAEKNVLKAVWPGADLKNCVFHMAQAQWRKSYNAASLVDVVCSEMEDMYRSRLTLPTAAITLHFCDSMASCRKQPTFQMK